jgi:hypothetical protein
MERLRQQDVEQGIEQQTLNDDQRAAIADVRQQYEARLAEREILHQSDRAKLQDPAALDELEQNYRRDRDRFGRERDTKIEKIRSPAD